MPAVVHQSASRLPARNTAAHPGVLLYVSLRCDCTSCNSDVHRSVPMCISLLPYYPLCNSCVQSSRLVYIALLCDCSLFSFCVHPIVMMYISISEDCLFFNLTVLFCAFRACFARVWNLCVLALVGAMSESVGE